MIQWATADLCLAHLCRAGGDGTLSAGILYIVGTVPGAPDLITYRGLHHLRAATAVVYDAAVPPSLLSQAPPDAQRTAALGAETAPLLQGLVAAGHQVCWLTSGAPAPDVVAQLIRADVSYEGVPAATGPVERHGASERLPLAGVRILVTRARGQAGALSDQIRALGGEPWEVPVIEIADPHSWAPLDAAIAVMDQYRWLVLTSPNGVRSFMARLVQAGRDARTLAHLQVVAVGPATAAALAAAGIRADLMPDVFRGAALPPLLAPHLQPGDRVLMPRSEIADPAYAEGLRALGALVDDVVAYRTVPARVDGAPLRAALLAGEIDYVAFTSGSTVRNLLGALGEPAAGADALRGARIAAIGSETAKAIRAAGLPVDVEASTFTIDGLIEAIRQDVARRR